jgi:hypothetical protein
MIELESLLPAITGAVGLASELVKGFRLWRQGKRPADAPATGSSARPARHGDEAPPRVSASEKDRLRRARQFERSLLDYNRSRDLDVFRSRLHFAANRELQRERHLAERSVVDTYPGTWLDDTFSRLPAAPLILFNPHLAQPAEGQGLALPPYNPLVSLFERFRSRNDRANLTVISFGRRAFRAEDETSQFYLREIAPLPAVVVGGEFDGHALAVKAALFGMHEGQVNWDGERLEIAEKTFTLGRIPIEGLQHELEAAMRRRGGPSSDGGVRHRAREAVLELCDLCLNTGLQLLVDHYFGTHPLFDYAPRLLDDVREKANLLRLPAGGLDGLLAGIEAHQSEIRAARRLLDDLRGRLEHEEDGVEEEEGLSVYEG